MVSLSIIWSSFHANSKPAACHPQSLWIFQGNISKAPIQGQNPLDVEPLRHCRNYAVHEIEVCIPVLFDKFSRPIKIGKFSI
jgi:hypothetical protein